LNRVGPEAEIRSMAWHSDAADTPSALILRAALSGMIRRLERQTPRGTDPAEVREMILAAIEARIPGAEVDLQVEAKSGWPRLIRIRVTPPFPVGGQTTVLPVDVTWKA
jgi:hypothetical protein